MIHVDVSARGRPGIAAVCSCRPLLSATLPPWGDITRQAGRGSLTRGARAAAALRTSSVTATLVA